MTLPSVRAIGAAAVAAARQTRLSADQRRAAVDVLSLLPEAEAAIARGAAGEWLRRHRARLSDLGEAAAGLRPYERELRGSELLAAVRELAPECGLFEYYRACRPPKVDRPENRGETVNAYPSESAGGGA